MRLTHNAVSTFQANTVLTVHCKPLPKLLLKKEGMITWAPLKKNSSKNRNEKLREPQTRPLSSPHLQPLYERQKHRAAYLSWYHVHSNTACENTNTNLHYHPYNSRHLLYMLLECCTKPDLCCIHEKETRRQKPAQPPSEAVRLTAGFDADIHAGVIEHSSIGTEAAFHLLS